jgi:hypothetical protein
LKEENMSEKIDDGKVIGDGKIEQAAGGYEEPAVQSNGDDAETNGIFFIPVFVAVNANIVTNANATMNVNLATTANVTIVANTNSVANVNVATNTNTGE